MQKIDTTNWLPFKVGDLFPDIKKPKVYHTREVKEDIKGVPYIVRSKFNNGIKYKVKPIDIELSPKGVISFGAENAAFFYRSEEWCSGRDIYYINTQNIPMYACLFLCACLNRLTHKYSYNYGLFPDLLKKETILLPAIDKNTPNWQYMEEYMQSIETQTKVKIRELDNLKRKGKPLNTSYWQPFKVGKLFRIKGGKGITKYEISTHEGSLPAIQSGEANFGCIGFIDKEYCISKGYVLSEGECLTVARSGSSGYVGYQSSQCVVGDSAKILEPIFEANMLRLLFLRAILMENKKKYAYDDKVTNDNYAQDIILLPAIDENTPDWQYMEMYMRGVEAMAKNKIDALQQSKQRVSPTPQTPFTNYGTVNIIDNSRNYNIK